MLVLRLVAIRNFFMHMKCMICIVTFFTLKTTKRSSVRWLLEKRPIKREGCFWLKVNQYKPTLHREYVFANGKILNKVFTFSALCFPILIRNFVSCSFSGTNVFMASTSWRWSSAEMWNGFYGWGKQVMVKRWTPLQNNWQFARTVRQTPENRPTRIQKPASFLTSHFIIVSIPEF